MMQILHFSPPFRDIDNGWEINCGEPTDVFLPRALHSLSLSNENCETNSYASQCTSIHKYYITMGGEYVCLSIK